MSEAWKGGSTRRHRKARALVLAANQQQPPRGNGGRCTLAIPDVCTGIATEAHHVLGKAKTGDDPAYMVAVCGECNRAIGDPNKRDPQPQPRTKW